MKLRMLALTFAAPLASGCSNGLCDADSLASALADASQGDVVRVGECTIEGSFAVPDGVRLEGAGARSVLRSAEGDAAPVVDLAPGADTTLAAVRIEVRGGGVGVRVVGEPGSAGTARVEDAIVSVERGVAIGARGLARLELRALDVRGPIAGRDDALFAPDAQSETGTYGIAAFDVGALDDLESGVRIADVRVHGFALGGASFVESVVSWREDEALLDRDADGVDDAEVFGNRGPGIAVFDGRADLEGVDVEDSLSGRGVEAIAIASVASVLHATGVELRGGAGYGVFADDSEVELVDLRASDLALPAVRAQRGTLSLARAELLRNGGAGVLALDVRRTVVRDARIADHFETQVHTDSGAGFLPMAEGILARRVDVGVPESVLDLQIDGAVLEGNARTGLLIDAGGTEPSRLLLERLRANAPQGAFGVVAQDTVLASGWDSAVVREGAAALADAAFAGGIDVVGIIMPPARARIESL